MPEQVEHLSRGGLLISNKHVGLRNCNGWCNATDEAVPSQQHIRRSLDSNSNNTTFPPVSNDVLPASINL